jgi:AraC family transcriptional regulator
MDVHIMSFPATPVAMIVHRGAPEREHETAIQLVQWRIAHRLHPDRHASYGVHHTDPSTVQPEEHRVDFCVAYEGAVEPNAQGITASIIPANRCAVARHVGSRAHVAAAAYLFREWLPHSSESLGDFPVFFHYVNVGPQVQEHEMITDVYLPLR